MQFKTTTALNAEGFNISYSTEKKCAQSLEDIVPKGWTVSFQWSQILFSDVQYDIDKRKKLIRVVYNQNLSHWWPQVRDAIKKGLKDSY